MAECGRKVKGEGSFGHHFLFIFSGFYEVLLCKFGTFSVENHMALKYYNTMCKNHHQGEYIKILIRNHEVFICHGSVLDSKPFTKVLQFIDSLLGD